MKGLVTWLKRGRQNPPKQEGTPACMGCGDCSPGHEIRRRKEPMPDARLGYCFHCEIGMGDDSFKPLCEWL